MKKKRQAKKKPSHFQKKTWLLMDTLRLLASAHAEELQLPPYDEGAVRAFQTCNHVQFSSEVVFWLTKVSRQTGPNSFLALFQDSGCTLDAEMAMLTSGEATRPLRVLDPCPLFPGPEPKPIYTGRQADILRAAVASLTDDSHVILPPLPKWMTMASSAPAAPAVSLSSLHVMPITCPLPTPCMLVVSGSRCGAVYVAVPVDVAYIYFLVPDFATFVELGFDSDFGFSLRYSKGGDDVECVCK
jgi:hypothetical protein